MEILNKKDKSQKNIFQKSRKKILKSEFLWELYYPFHLRLTFEGGLPSKAFSKLDFEGINRIDLEVGWIGKSGEE